MKKDFVNPSAREHTYLSKVMPTERVIQELVLVNGPK